MQKKRRRGRTSTKASVEDEIAHLRGLDLGGLRARWQSVFQRSAPAHLTRHLLFAVIAYRLQVDRFGDLDHATKQVLDRSIAVQAGMSARLASLDQKRIGLTPGTVLVREWDRRPQRVMVGFQCRSNWVNARARQPESKETAPAQGLCRGHHFIGSQGAVPTSGIARLPPRHWFQADCPSLSGRVPVGG